MPLSFWDKIRGVTNISGSACTVPKCALGDLALRCAPSLRWISPFGIFTERQRENLSTIFSEAEHKPMSRVM